MALSEDARIRETRIDVEAAVGSVVAGRTVARVRVDQIDARAAVETTRWQTVVEIGGTVRIGEARRTHALERVGLRLNTRGAVLARLRRARVYDYLALRARIARIAIARVRIDSLLVASASVLTRRARAHVNDNLAESSRRAGQALTHERVGRGRDAHGAVLARLRRAKVNAELTIRAVVARRT